jgi:uncharacterized protein YggU (UPF0235/DUF167 family)
LIKEVEEGLIIRIKIVPNSSKNDIIQASFLNADGDISEKLSIPLNTTVV